MKSETGRVAEDPEIDKRQATTKEENGPGG